MAVYSKQVVRHSSNHSEYALMRWEKVTIEMALLKTINIFVFFSFQNAPAARVSD